METLFFLDMSDVKSLIMAKRDKLLYPTYECRRHGAPFQTREQMMDYMGASHLLHLFLAASDQLPDQSGAWSSSSSDDVPIPGRPIRPPDLPADFCQCLVVKACLALHDDACFDLSKDPMSQHDGKFKSLAIFLDEERAKHRTTLSELMETLMSVDSAPLAMFEPLAVGSASAASAAASDQLQIQSQLSQSQLLYLRRFKREYVLLYILRFGVDCKKVGKEFIFFH